MVQRSDLVGYKDAACEASFPMTWCRAFKLTECNDNLHKHVLFLCSDGGPYHRLTYASVQLCFFETRSRYTNKKHELYIHMPYHNTVWHQSLQSSTERHRTGNTNPTWTTALNCHSPWGCLLVAFPSPTRGEGLFDLQYLSLWMYVECKDVCKNFQIKTQNL